MTDNAPIVTDQRNDPKVNPPPTGIFKLLRRDNITEFEVIFFGLALILGSRCSSWNLALEAGFNTMISDTVLVGISFLCLCFCVGEMTSALPFSGGIYGFVRGASGPFLGFVTASFEAVFSLLYIVSLMYLLIQIPLLTGVVDTSFTPYLILIIYGFILSINLMGGKPFWILISLLGFGILLLLVIYLCGTLADVSKSNVNFKANCQTSIPTTFDSIMTQRMYAVTQFQGLQYLPLLCKYVKEPRESIPRAMAICSSGFLLFSVFIGLAACSSSPGQSILQSVTTPLMYGFSKVFSTDSVTGIWLNLPGLFAPTLAMLFCSGRQLYKIAHSGLLPNFLTHTTPGFGTPGVSLIFVTLISTGLSLCVYYCPSALSEIKNLSSISNHIVFLNAFFAYLFFRRNFSGVPRSFESPLGIYGAIYGIASELLGFISLYYDQNTTYYSLFALIAYFVIITIFYWSYFVNHQKFSPDEKKMMFKAYLINANRDKHRRMLRHNRVGCHTQGHTKDLKNHELSTNMNTSVHCREPAPTSPKAVPPPIEEERHPFHVSLSDKIFDFLGSKMNAVMPMVERMNQQFEIVSSGGELGTNDIAALEEKLGFDVEASILVNQNS